MWPVAAAIIASALISAYAASQQGGGFAPAGGGEVGGGGKPPFQVPDIYGQTGGGYSLLGKQQLSQKLTGEPNVSPAYGPPAGSSPLEQYQASQATGRGK